MQKNDLLMDDELTAAFLDEDIAGDLSIGGDSAPTPTPDAETQEWSESDDDFPGQLAVDVYETDDRLVVKARTAGVDKKDLDVSISEGILTISGTLSGGDETEANNFHIQECYWGEFTRTLALPVPVKEDQVEAVLKDGVLTISFEKVKQNKAKVITIQ